MSELVEYRMHQQIAQEIYRQQMLQRLPDPYPSMLPVPPPRHFGHHHHIPPPVYTLTGIEAKLQNYDLWNSFSPHGTEMIITKSGRRMFPSVRVNLSGLEDDASYCLMLEMVPIGDCRFKFSGSQWVPAGGAEPQSPQRMYLHPDSPALGSHWNSQPVSFSKVKLTNNTLDSNGHVVLTSMHKYRPRLHVIRTSEPSQIPWSPSQVFFFSDTDFVAVTAYQNDQITKLKIDNNPFAKGFRETGQSRCKRKHLQTVQPHHSHQSSSSNSQLVASKSLQRPNSPRASNSDEQEGGPIKRKRTNSSGSGSVSSLDDSGLSICGSSSRTSSPNAEELLRISQQQQINSTEYRKPMHPMIPPNFAHQPNMESIINYQQQLQQHLINMQNVGHSGLRPSWLDFALYFSRNGGVPHPNHHPQQHPGLFSHLQSSQFTSPYEILQNQHNHSPRPTLVPSPTISPGSTTPNSHHNEEKCNKPSKSSFTIEAILGSR